MTGTPAVWVSWQSDGGPAVNGVLGRETPVTSRGGRRGRSSRYLGDPDASFSAPYPDRITVLSESVATIKRRRGEISVHFRSWGLGGGCIVGRRGGKGERRIGRKDGK